MAPDCADADAHRPLFQDVESYPSAMWSPPADPL